MVSSNGRRRQVLQQGSALNSDAACSTIQLAALEALGCWQRSLQAHLVTLQVVTC